jgi:hypothetical protein
MDYWDKYGLFRVVLRSYLRNSWPAVLRNYNGAYA